MGARRDITAVVDAIDQQRGRESPRNGPLNGTRVPTDISCRYSGIESESGVQSQAGMR
jgi:hypothetical protein